MRVVGGLVRPAEIPCSAWGSGPPVLLLHGITTSSADWAEIAPALATGRQVLAYDQRGHGDRADVGPYSLDRLTEDVTAFLDARGLAKVDLIGHSMGGVVAMRFALAHPSRVRSLLLISATAEPVSPVPAEVILRLATVGRERGMAALAQIIDRIDNSLPFRSKPQRDRFRHDFARTSVEAYATLGRELSQYPSMLDELARLDIAALVMVGEHDTPLRSAAVRLAGTLRRARFVVVPDAAHAPHLENPTHCLAAILAHLDTADDADVRSTEPGEFSHMTVPTMPVRDVLTEAYGRVHRLVHDALASLRPGTFVHQIEPGTNSIAWLVWHLTRIQDHHIADIMGEPELWADPQWATRTGVERDVSTRGQGDGPDEIAALAKADSDGVSAYHDAVMARTFGYLSGVTEAELARIIDTSYTPPVSVGVRLVSVLSDNLQHAGQALFVRGMHERMEQAR
ncbi:alpha/beta fold hydrolase [Verrucosispora sp. WMMD573]|uniref:mycothiol transferase n=1 Tax=Verrucosispora sp. WMMD573 TaxID=3015149 RepID=UPI00248ACB16|nr:alpha/beta fold hydrolase [Verrucosispora sp. WMMD573]WBB53719.1 alpha/beta fold hydrolase [Verrucosispora sp. WMMD573]